MAKWDGNLRLISWRVFLDSQVLDVSKNALTEVPDAISGLKALVTLDLSVNPLGE